MKEPKFIITAISGRQKLVPGVKPYVQMTLGVHSTPEAPDSPMPQVKMRRLEATLGSFGPADMFAVDRHLWVRWDTEDGEVRFHCRYYKERPGKVAETGKLIVETMEEFIGGLRLKVTRSRMSDSRRKNGNSGIGWHMFSGLLMIVQILSKDDYRWRFACRYYLLG